MVLFVRSLARIFIFVFRDKKWQTFQRNPAKCFVSVVLLFSCLNLRRQDGSGDHVSTGHELTGTKGCPDSFVWRGIQLLRDSVLFWQHYTSEHSSGPKVDWNLCDWSSSTALVLWISVSWEIKLPFVADTCCIRTRLCGYFRQKQLNFSNDLVPSD